MGTRGGEEMGFECCGGGGWGVRGGHCGIWMSVRGVGVVDAGGVV